MKVILVSLISAMLSSSSLVGSTVGKNHFLPLPGDEDVRMFRIPAGFKGRLLLRSSISGRSHLRWLPQESEVGAADPELLGLKAYFESETRRRNLRIRLIQQDPEAEMEHHRYRQFYKDLEVFGGEVIHHYQRGNWVGISGRYYEIENLDTSPLLSREAAVELFRADLMSVGAVEKDGESRLLIYPLRDGGVRLAYRIVLEEGMNTSLTGILDARTGEVLLKYPNVQSDDLPIAVGIGYHGELYKIPTTFKDGLFWLYDEKITRPFNQYTNIYNVKTFPSDADNYWSSCAVIVNVHAYTGWTYDYYSLVHQRRGLDDADGNIRAVVHSQGAKDRSGWNDSLGAMVFFDPGPLVLQMGAALDVVAHEYSHGVTHFTSGLISHERSGALNESFSDIMATAVEFFWQTPGEGFNKADWLLGEDAHLDYGPDHCSRNLADPKAKGNPCHLTQFVSMPDTAEGDWGGVHLNSTLFSHAFYLLAQGGTNRVSQVAVTGIGLEKATRIFYRAWTYYLTPTSTFTDAANALVESAKDLYGPAQTEEITETEKALRAIGAELESPSGEGP